MKRFTPRAEPWTAPFDLPWHVVLTPLARAEDSLARLDDRLRGSPVREGWIARSHFLDAAASAWISGELVVLEDLILRDAGMDVRVPTEALTRAEEVLRIRRRIAGATAWALSAEGLDALRGKAVAKAGQGRAEVAPPVAGRAGLADEIAAVDAALERTNRLLRDLDRPNPPPRDPLVYDPDWNEEERLSGWRGVAESLGQVPPVLAAALCLLAWSEIQPLQHQPWLGRLLAAALLRERGKARAHLPCLFLGRRVLPRERRRPETMVESLVLEIESIGAAAREGMREHDRLMLARLQFQHRLKGRRSTSRLPDLIDYVLATPLVSAGMVAKRLKVSQRAAQDLVAELGLREITGRGRYRAWGLM